MDSNAYCRDKLKQSGSSFALGFRLLSAPRRQALTAVYAFCREVDDVVDGAGAVDSVLARTTLNWWRGQIATTFAGGRPEHPVCLALQQALRHFPLPPEHFMALVDGMEMDLTDARYADFAALRLYCQRVAGGVGLLAAQIFGLSDARTLEYAHALGLALQLTNIIRDVGEDARRGRIYLPADEMRRFEVRPSDILNIRATPAFFVLMRHQIERARAQFQTAYALLPMCDRRRQTPGLIMGEIYRALLEEIDRDGCRVLSHRLIIPPGRQVRIALRTWLKPPRAAQP